MASVFSKQPIAITFTDLSIDDIAILTRILSRPPTAWFQAGLITDAELIKTLPRHLLAPIPWQRLVVSLFPTKADVPGASPLCTHHKPLNAQLIHSIFTALKQEVGPHFAKLRARIYDSLSGEHLRLVRSLHSVQALWTPPSKFGTTFLDETPRWRYQGDSCEACILATIGGDVATVVDLRTVIMARCRRDRNRDARFLAWVDGWADLFVVSGKKVDIRIKSEQAADWLRHLRKSSKSRQKRSLKQIESARQPREVLKWGQSLGEAESSRLTPSSHAETLRKLESNSNPFSDNDPFADDKAKDEEIEIIGHYAASISVRDTAQDESCAYIPPRTEWRPAHKITGRWPPLAGFQSLLNLPQSASVQQRGQGERGSAHNSSSLYFASTPTLASANSFLDESLHTDENSGWVPTCSIPNRHSGDIAPSHAEEYRNLFKPSPFRDLDRRDAYPGESVREKEWNDASRLKEVPAEASSLPTHDPSKDAAVSDVSPCHDRRPDRSEPDRSPRCTRWGDASRWSKVPPEAPIKDTARHSKANDGSTCRGPHPDRSSSQRGRPVRDTVWCDLF